MGHDTTSVYWTISVGHLVDLSAVMTVVAVAHGCLVHRLEFYGYHFLETKGLVCRDTTSRGAVLLHRPRSRQNKIQYLQSNAASRLHSLRGTGVMMK